MRKHLSEDIKKDIDSDLGGKSQEIEIKSYQMSPQNENSTP